MHHQESDEQVRCASCGALIAPDTERGYGFGFDNYVCWECALQRGGVYDADQDRWRIVPDVQDLYDERRRY